MLSLTAVAQESQTAYNFLRMPESAHAAALGGDNISIIEDDATLALSNPALLSSVGGRTVTLGPRILRTETAAVISAALAMQLWGDM